MKPDWECPGVKLYYGDCLKILPHLPTVDAVVTDPPYGMNWDTDYTRFTNGLHHNRNHGKRIKGDERAFDPSPWLVFPTVLLWGYQFMARTLPLGTILVWNKKRERELGTFLSDCELAWMQGGNGVYLYSHVWHGFDRQTERGKVLHPTQKPIKLMKWCLERAKVPQGAVVLDPYMGSGTTGVACIQTGRKFIGIEIDPEHFKTAVERISKAKNLPGLRPKTGLFR